MAEAQTAGTNGAAKKERVAQMVKMTDGREVEFVGTRKIKKDTVIDESKIELAEDGSKLVVSPGAVSVRMDIISGDTRLIPIPLSLFCDFAGHGGEQKFGDTLASPKEKQLSPADMLIALDDLAEVIAQGKWSLRREGDGFAGASIVIQALMEVTGKDQQVVKDFLAGKLEASKKESETKGTKAMTRKELYDSFRNVNSKVGKVIQRLEQERITENSAVDADEAAAELEAA